MNKPVFGLVSGLAVIVLALIAIGIINLPQAEGADTPVRPSRCAVASPRAPDQGYGVFRRTDTAPCPSRG